LLQGTGCVDRAKVAAALVQGGIFKVGSIVAGNVVYRWGQGCAALGQGGILRTMTRQCVARQGMKGKALCVHSRRRYPRRINCRRDTEILSNKRGRESGGLKIEGSSS
jgi:hypothetical protein